MFFAVFWLVGPAGFEPAECGSQSPVPYHLAMAHYCRTANPHANLPFLILNGVGDGTRTHDNQNHNLALYQLNYVHHMVRVKRFELLAHALEGRCSIQLS